MKPRRRRLAFTVAALLVVTVAGCLETSSPEYGRGGMEQADEETDRKGLSDFERGYREGLEDAQLDQGDQDFPSPRESQFPDCFNEPRC